MQIKNWNEKCPRSSWWNRVATRWIKYNRPRDLKKRRCRPFSNNNNTSHNKQKSVGVSTEYLRWTSCLQRIHCVTVMLCPNGLPIYIPRYILPFMLRFCNSYWRKKVASSSTFRRCRQGRRGFGDPGRTKTQMSCRLTSLSFGKVKVKKNFPMFSGILDGKCWVRSAEVITKHSTTRTQLTQRESVAKKPTRNFRFFVDLKKVEILWKLWPKETWNLHRKHPIYVINYHKKRKNFRNLHISVNLELECIYYGIVNYLSIY